MGAPSMGVREGSKQSQVVWKASQEPPCRPHLGVCAWKERRLGVWECDEPGSSWCEEVEEATEEAALMRLGTGVACLRSGDRLSPRPPPSLPLAAARAAERGVKGPGSPCPAAATAAACPVELALGATPAAALRVPGPGARSVNRAGVLGLPALPTPQEPTWKGEAPEP